MSVYTFDSFEEARHALWEFDPGPEYYCRVARLFALAFRIAPPRCRRGIRAYASIEEAQKDRFHFQTGLRAP